MENPNHKWRFLAGKNIVTSTGHGFHGYVKSLWDRSTSTNPCRGLPGFDSCPYGSIWLFHFKENGKTKLSVASAWFLWGSFCQDDGVICQKQRGRCWFRDAPVTGPIWTTMTMAVRSGFRQFFKTKNMASYGTSSWFIGTSIARCWLVVWNIFFFHSVWNNHPNWLYNIFQRGRYTTKQGGKYQGTAPNIQDETRCATHLASGYFAAQRTTSRQRLWIGSRWPPEKLGMSWILSL